MKIKGRLDAVLLVFTIAKARAKEPELPICPTNFAFFPQNLPKHCRLAPGAYPAVPAPQPAPFPSEIYQSPSPDKVPSPIPFPVPPGVPGFPPGFPGFPPGMMGPGPVPMPMPMPAPAPGPAHKLPVIVMPFYSPDTSYKQRKPSHRQRKSSHSHDGKSNRYIDVFRSPHSYDSDTNRVFLETPSCELEEKIENTRRSYDGGPGGRIIGRPGRRTRYDNDASSEKDTSSEGFWKDHQESRRSSRRKNRKHKSKRARYPKKDLLTPILQYVTKDGYVIFEKKISKDEAKDWLSMKKKEVQKNDGPDEADLDNVNHDNKNDDNSEPNEMNEDVEILDGHKEKSIEKVDVQTQKAPKRQYSHKMRSHHTKEEKQKVSANVK